MNRLFRSAALAVGLSLAATAALACGPDGCGKDKDKDKDGKMECCCDKMKDKAATPAKPGEKPPAQPEHEHKH